MLALACGLAAAGGDSVPVSGRVIDQSGGAANGVLSVRIINLFDQKTAKTVSTNATGDFATDLPADGQYALEVVDAPGIITWPIGNALISTKSQQGKPPAEVSVVVTVTKGASIRGTIVDSDSNTNVSGMTVLPLINSFLRGEKQLGIVGRDSTTDSDGRFELTDVPPGEYTFEIAPKIQPEKRPANLAGSEGSGYAPTIWPGGGDAASAGSIRIFAGMSLDLGEMRIKKQELHDITVNVAAGDCQANDSYSVDLGQYMGITYLPRDSGTVTCGHSVRLVNIASGTYTLTVAEKLLPGQIGRIGSSRVDVGRENVNVTQTVTSPSEIKGNIVIVPSPSRDHAELPLGLRVHFWPNGDNAFFSPVPTPPTVKVDKSGAFAIATGIPPGGRITVSVYGLPSNLYLKSTGYNGVGSVEGSRFRIDPANPYHRLTLTLGDDPASITSITQDNTGRPLSGISVLLVPWPLGDALKYPDDLQELQSDASGAVVFRRLRPGTYRMVAVYAGDRQRLEAPFALQNALRSAEDIHVDPNSNKVSAIHPSSF